MLLDSRSYSGTATSSDHFMVITRMMLRIPNSSSKYRNTRAELCNRRYDVANLESKEEVQVVFRFRLAETLTPILKRLEGGRESVEVLWTSLKNTIHEMAMETIGQRPATPRDRAKLLSEHQRLLRTEIQAAHDPDTATMLRGRQKETLKQLHRQLKEDAIAYWNDKVKDVVRVTDDSRRLYPTLKCLA